MSNRAVLRRRLAGVACLLLALAASGSVGPPSEAQLPEIALGWPLLLHIERAAAAVGLVGFALLVIWRAGRGEFPLRFAQIEYEARSVATEMQRGAELLRTRADEIEEQMEALERRVAEFQKEA